MRAGSVVSFAALPCRLTITAPSAGEKIAISNQIHTEGTSDTGYVAVDLKLQKKDAAGDWVTLKNETVPTESDPGGPWEYNFHPQEELGDYRIELLKMGVVKDFVEFEIVPDP